MLRIVIVLLARRQTADGAHIDRIGEHGSTWLDPDVLSHLSVSYTHLTLAKLIVEAVILLSARAQTDGGKMLRAAAQAYKVDTDAIALKVKHEFTAKEKARSAAKIEPKPVPKTLKKTA